MKTKQALSHSRDLISIVKNIDGITVIKKQTKGSGERLQQQARKQKILSSMLKEHSELKYLIDVPEIISEKKTKDYFQFEMIYCGGYNIINVLEICDFSYIYKILHCLSNYLEWEFDMTKKEVGWQGLLLNKLSHLQTIIDPSIIDEKIFFQIVDYVQNFNNKICGGFCHGDLTFSNMIFTDKIILIDMLPVYHETPIQDMAKLMQEVNLEWSALLIGRFRDQNKINIAYEFIGEKITLLIKRICVKYGIDYSLILIYYLIAIIRIIPYASKKRIVLAVQKEVNNKLEELKHVI